MSQKWKIFILVRGRFAFVGTVVEMWEGQGGGV